MISPLALTLTRTKQRPPINGRRTAASQKLLRKYLSQERIWSFVVELLLFGLLTAVSAWPIIQAVEALRLL